MLGGSRAYALENLVQFGGFWCTFLSDHVLINSLNINTFLYKTYFYIYKKKNYYIGTRLIAMGYLAPGEILKMCYN